jgi:hypothetical protein
MRLDFQEVLAGTFGKLVVLTLLMMSAIWVGSLLASVALAMGDGWTRRTSVPLNLVAAPLLQFSPWILANVAILAAWGVILLITDRMGHAAWGSVVALESLFAMLGGGLKFSDPWDGAKAWAFWFILLAMFETGVWLAIQMRRNQSLRELAELRAQNAMRHAEREAQLRDESSVKAD